jgi:hypothetical protein
MSVRMIFGGIFAMILGIILYFVGHGEAESAAAKFAPILFYPGIISIAIGGTIEIIKVRNWFIGRYESVTEYKARVNVLKKQYTDLTKELKELLEKYIAHEKGLIDAVTNRKTEELRILLERYPSLKADNSVQNTLVNMVELRKNVTTVTNKHNEVAQEYNTTSAQLPRGLFRPRYLLDKIPYLNAESEK